MRLRGRPAVTGQRPLSLFLKLLLTLLYVTPKDTFKQRNRWTTAAFNRGKSWILHLGILWTCRKRKRFFPTKAASHTFWPGCHIWRRRWSYRWERCQASNSSLRQSARVSAAANVKTLDGFWCWTTLFHRLSAWHHWKVLRKPQDNSQQVCGARNVFYKVSGYLQLCLLWPHQVF